MHADRRVSGARECCRACVRTSALVFAMRCTCAPFLTGNPPSFPPHAGYGELPMQAWPFGAAVAISPSHPLAANSSRHPLGGCGACLELQCDPRPGNEVRIILTRPVHAGQRLILARPQHAQENVIRGLPHATPAAGSLPRHRRQLIPRGPRHRHLPRLQRNQGQSFKRSRQALFILAISFWQGPPPAPRAPPAHPSSVPPPLLHRPAAHPAPPGFPAEAGQPRPGRGGHPLAPGGVPCARSHHR
jgi:hypothetical protein